MNMYYCGSPPTTNYLAHHGILGQKWGVRRFQNPDGTWTSEGKIRYGAPSHRVADAMKTAGKTVGRGIIQGAKTTGKAVARGAKAVGDRVGAASKQAARRYKVKHAWMMSDEELRSYIDRLGAEKRLSDIQRELDSRKLSRQVVGVGGTVIKKGASIADGALAFIGDVAGMGIKTLAGAGFTRLANYIKKTELERDAERLALENKKYDDEVNLRRKQENVRRLDDIYKLELKGKESQARVNARDAYYKDVTGSDDPGYYTKIAKLERDKRIAQLEKDIRDASNVKNDIGDMPYSKMESALRSGEGLTAKQMSDLSKMFNTVAMAQSKIDEKSKAAGKKAMYSWFDYDDYVY